MMGYDYCGLPYPVVTTNTWLQLPLKSSLKSRVSINYIALRSYQPLSRSLGHMDVIYLPNEPLDLIYSPSFTFDILVELHFFSDVDIGIIRLATQDTIRRSRNPCFQRRSSTYELLPSIHHQSFGYS